MQRILVRGLHGEYARHQARCRSHGSAACLVLWGREAHGAENGRNVLHCGRQSPQARLTVWAS